MGSPGPARAARQSPVGIGLGLILLSLAVTLGGGLLFKGPCLSGEWGDGRQYLRLCYSDIVPLYGTEHLQEDRLPYLDACPDDPGTNCDEYPLLTMYTMRVAAWAGNWAGDGFGEFFAANAAILIFAAVVTAAALGLVAGRKALYFALAPTLLIYGFMNWDLVAVALATGATLAFHRRKDVLTGVLLGLGTAAKIYPALLVIPFAAERFRQREPDSGIHLTWAAAGTWAAVNLPFFLAAPGEWTHFFRFNAERGADWDSLWFGACDAATGNSACVPTKLLNLGSVLAFIVLSAVVWRWRRSRDPHFGRWTAAFPLIVIFLLTNKVYSPQYSLWLLPWFALAFPGLKGSTRATLFALFSAADAAVFVTRFSFFGRLQNIGGFPIEAFEVAIAVRAAVLVGLVLAWVLQREVSEEASPPVVTRTAVPATA